MKKVSKKAPECKVSRAVELVQGMDFGGTCATLRICNGKDESLYTVQPLRSEVGGRAFRLVKQGRVETLEDGSGWYDLLLDGPVNSYCSCPGCERWGHCKHVWAVEVAVRRKWL
jgi:hypothetical protein